MSGLKLLQDKSMTICCMLLQVHDGDDDDDDEWHIPLQFFLFRITKPRGLGRFSSSSSFDNANSMKCFHSRSLKMRDFLFVSS